MRCLFDSTEHVAKGGASEGSEMPVASESGGAEGWGAQSAEEAGKGASLAERFRVFPLKLKRRLDGSGRDRRVSPRGQRRAAPKAVRAVAAGCTVRVAKVAA